MANYPIQLRKRDELNLRLGIKSSLSQLRSVIASLYVIYMANDKQAQVTYSKESINGGLTYIKLEDKLAQQIDAKFPAVVEKISSLVNKTPLFTAQLEALQVGIELFFHLAKINFVASGLSERTGSSRFQKKLSFATNMILVDLYLSSHSSEDVNNLLAAWLEDKPFASKLEDGLKMLLNTFTEETQYKIRDNNLDEIVFNQEGVYDTVLSDGEVISKDANEPVGPFRIYKSYIASGMHPYLIEQKQEIKLNGSVSHADLENYAKLVSTALDITPRRTTIEREVEPSKHVDNELPANNLDQRIYYGAPGTGKSHEVKRQTGERLESGEEVDLPNVFRTTFHPDTDYASFVGCYKPCMVSKEPIFDAIALKSKLLEIKNEGGGYACHKFGYKYWESLDRLSANEIKDILHVGGFSDNMAVEVQKGIALAEKFHNETSQIAYTFVPQVFTDAYVYAYNNPTEQTYLVIEEINRGNCAQIFGDLFQLLDRKDGKSEYNIKADKDLAKYLADKLGADSEGIKDGKLCLPANLHILATMNTSDQSLFPMDSAFKRRWEWVYVPINYTANIKSGTFDITIGDKSYSWVKFIKNVNEKIFDLTQSEDKQMGNFFIKQSIDEKGFKSKVMFYLWYEVLRDETENNKYFFYKKTSVEGKDVLSKFTFKDLFGDKATETLQQFMDYLKVDPK